ncbi:uncharacterized protein A1O5_09816 [Cladophialophora psammophila CBS 110553]|uniref:Uncharacterized protein n=1 Tax=Cladophialophora psammophila CBS 110553 TaxID=1182543 RepID=W9X9Q2_9EURO|nr:uncharacterized protein A1O5_09816 [Cladophialophora psammophila CBS 110553]EXJ67169.1 hypothetical protein A1O5_09816 [Cladophialophora psammophila CBS 110553]
MLPADNGTYGPPVEEVRYFYKYWPIGIAVSSTSRIFVCYTRGDYEYTVTEVHSTTSETPFPCAGLNLPSDALNTTFNGIEFASANSTGLISVQALYTTPATSSGRGETLWLLDTGRPTIQSSSGSYTMPYAQPGGPKVVGVNLSNNTVYATYTFPPTVHFPRLVHERHPLRYSSRARGRLHRRLQQRRPSGNQTRLHLHSFKVPTLKT